MRALHRHNGWSNASKVLACLGTVLAAGTVVSKLLGAGRDSVAGKVVLITGGSRGLGFELAREFGSRGAKLILVARDLGELTAARQRLLEIGSISNWGDVLILQADVSKGVDVNDVVSAGTAHFGAVDVLVNNAAVIHVGPFEDQTAGAFQESMDINFFGALYAVQAVLPQMLRRGSGNIVNIASIGGKVAVPHMLPYTSSKFALVGFSEGLHAELREKNVFVTTVCPGLMRTGSAPYATVSGDIDKEQQWFSLAASTPIVAIAADAAAAKIVRSVLDRRAEITITPQAFLAARFNGVFPETTQWMSSLANRFVLPKPVPMQVDQS